MKLAKNSLYSLLGMALPLIVSLLTIPLYIEHIGSARYGALAIAWILLGYFGQADFGIGRAITQRISALEDRSAAVMATAVGSAVIGVLAFGLISAILVYISARHYFAGPFEVEDALRQEAIRSTFMLALCTPLVGLFGVLSGSLMGLERFRLVSIAQMVGGIGGQVLPLASALLFGPDLTMLILAALAARAIAIAILGIAVWRVFLRGHQLRYSRDEFRHLLGFGLWVMVSALIGPFMLFADRFVIGAVLNAVAVAAYAIPYQIASRTQTVPAAVIQALFPRFAAEQTNQSRDRCSAYTAFIGQLYAPIVIGLICIAAPLMQIWLGDNLDQRSVAVAQIILAGFWCNAIASVAYSYLQARGNPRFTALLHLAELPVYFCLLFGLGYAFGLPGVAAAFAIRCAIDGTALFWKARIVNKALLQRLAVPSALIATAIVINFDNDSWAISLISGVVLGLLSLVSLLLQMPQAIRARVTEIPLVGRYFSAP